MHDADNGANCDEIREYGSHIGFAWAVQKQRAGVGSPEQGRALSLAADVDEKPLRDLLAEQGDPEELMRYVALSILDDNQRDTSDAADRFWRDVADATGMVDFIGIPHKREFVQGFLDAQWIVLNQPVYHNALPTEF